MRPKKNKKEYNLISLFEDFNVKMHKGRRLQKSGKRVSEGTITNYENICRLLKDFSARYDFPLRVISIHNLNLRDLKKEQTYWRRFYREFSSFLYDKLKLYDNYVGSVFKLLRTFFNYLNQEMNINTGHFHKKFYIHYDEIPIVVISPERLNYLIHSAELDGKLSPRQREARDFFIFGCTVGLRFSDLVRLKKSNLEITGEHSFLTVLSKKTQTYTRVRLPGYAIAITQKYRKGKMLLPHFNIANFNVYIKEVAALAGFAETIEKTRRRRGIPEKVKTEDRKELRFYELVTSHTMRRTAITTMLSLGMNEQLVRQVSGHSANSKEFYKYVLYSQAYLNKEITKVHDLLERPMGGNEMLNA